MPLAHTAEETALIIGGTCKPSWLREKARRNEIPYVMLGGAYNFTGAHISEILALFDHPATPAAPAKRRVPARKPAPGPSPVVLLTASTPRLRKQVA